VSEESIALTAATEGASLMGVESAGNSSFHTNENSVSLQIGVVYKHLWQFILVPWVPLPVKGTSKYTWKIDSDSRVVEFELWRGYCASPNNNEFIGNLNFTGLAEDGTGRLKVSVHLNENNEANVTVKEIRTGRKSWEVFKVYSSWKYCRCRIAEINCDLSEYDPPPTCNPLWRRLMYPAIARSSDRVQL
jgi:hypothetical protein